MEIIHIFSFIIFVLAPGGQDSLFTRFLNYFDMLDLADLQLWDGDEGDHHGGDGCETWFTHQAEVVRQFAEQLNVTEAWIREDYQEMNELLIKFFHGTVSVVFTRVKLTILIFDAY